MSKHKHYFIYDEDADGYGGAGFVCSCGEMMGPDSFAAWVNSQLHGVYEGESRKTIEQESTKGLDSPVVCAVKRYPAKIALGSRSMHWDEEEEVWVVTEEMLGGRTAVTYYGGSELLAVSSLAEDLQTGEGGWSDDD